MDNSNASEAPLETAAGAPGPQATEAFELLRDETRLAILLALWKAHDTFAEDNTVPLSELYGRVYIGDSGNFTYHLDKLTGHFVEETDEGYELHLASLRIVQAVIAGAGLEERVLEPAEIDMPCYHCGAPVEIVYKDEHLYRVCTECEGSFGPEFTRELSAGTLGMMASLKPSNGDMFLQSC